MGARRLAVLGAGGCGREVLDVVDAINTSLPEPRWTILGVADDAPATVNLERLADRSIPYLGRISDALAALPGEIDVVLGVGTPEVRREIANRLAWFDQLSFPVFIHPRAHIGSQSSLGPGTVICAGAQISTNVRTGAHVHVNPNVTIGHDTVIQDFTSVNPGAIISGTCVIGSGVLVGAGSVTLQELTIGSGAVVGAAACVVRDVAPSAVVKGVPAE